MFVVGTHVPVRDAPCARRVTEGSAAGRPGRRRRRGPRRRAGGGLRYRPCRAVRGADGVVVGGARAARHRRPEAHRPAVLSVTAQIAIADAACIVLLPLVIDPAGHRGRRWARSRSPSARWCSTWCCGYFERPRPRASGCTSTPTSTGWPSNCGSACIMLFGLAALAVSTHVSIMLAGFALGAGRRGHRGAAPAWLVSSSASPRASSRRCSSSGSAPHFRCANSVRPSRSSSCWEWVSASARSSRTARAGCSVNR